MQKEVDPAVDLEAAALQVKKSPVTMATEQELARAELAMHSETLKDTAPVLEGVKVIHVSISLGVSAE